MHARMVPSKPKAWPLCTTKSLKYGFSAVDVQRSATVQPLGSVRDRDAVQAAGLPVADQDVAVRRERRLDDWRRHAVKST